MSTRESNTKAEERWRGLGVSDGVAAGQVLRIHTGARSVYRATLTEIEIERELQRFREAVESSRKQLEEIKERTGKELGAKHAYIFDAHLLMLDDRSLIQATETYIRQEHTNAEWAVRVVTDRLLVAYAQIKDDYLRERSADVEDVVRRILTALGGESFLKRHLTEDSVIVAEELLPSAIAELDFAHVRAFASDAGGWTSHAAIIARGLGIPAVVGLRDLHRRARTGDSIVVDAGTGLVVLHPSPATFKQFDVREARPALSNGAITTGETEAQPARTLDGVEIALRANVELRAEYEGVRHYGAQGIGLYRSEFLWSLHNGIPSEDDQVKAYTEVVALAGAAGATIRLFDLGGDKAGLAETDAERNPALGLRAIRFCLQHEEVLRRQIRACLRAAGTGMSVPLKVVLPMVSDITDVRRARRIINEECERLKAEGATCGEVKIGAMIEVPSAVLTAHALAREVDFFSLGTNDLVQYMLAVDRGNDDVAAWFRSLHPAVLRSIDYTLTAARAAAIPAVVCGEMASSPAYAFVLIGLGARDLSMTAAAIPRVRRMISGIHAERARQIAAECLQCETADDSEELVRTRLGEEWPQLFPPETLPTAKEMDRI
ncbi:MAG: phosphoenolpyruvate--protein phosphotransferase [Pyrinomonadaceae bacterium]|nr:phosphoenolpyruvate--protein phosphotransferase [Pyrinomonadaceae bacterium]